MFFFLQEEAITAEAAAKQIADYFTQECMGKYVQYAPRAKGFKIWSTKVIDMPAKIQKMLALCTSSKVSNFKGSAANVRTRFLDQKLLEEEDCENLLGVCDSFQDWMILAKKKYEAKKDSLGEQLFKELEDMDLDEIR